MTAPHPSPPLKDPSKPMGFGDIIARIYPDLRRLAAAKAASRGLSATSLAQETVCRLISLPEPPKSTDEALAVGFRLLEWTGVDRVRSDAARRSRQAAVAEPERPEADPSDTTGRLVASLRLLAEHSPRKAEVLMLASLCNMPQERIAAVLEVSPRTVQHDLTFARAWIAMRMKER
jgi:DNA-directed RNA polymerase specialized sigma24 family protein